MPSAIAETSFDPAQISDLYSRTVAAASSKRRWNYEFLAKPARMRPNTAAAMPEVSRRLQDLHLPHEARHPLRRRPGVQGASASSPRRLRLQPQAPLRPALEEPNLYLLENAQDPRPVRTAREAHGERRSRSTTTRRSKACVRWTATPSRSSWPNPTPRFLQQLCRRLLHRRVAREVVEAYGDKIGEHPVGTGPFRLAEWKRSSRIVLARNPNYREVRYDEGPRPVATPDCRRSAGQASRAGGCRCSTEVHIAIIEEAQPRWLSFLNEEHDLLDRAARTSRRGGAQQPAGAQPGQARHPHVRYPRADVACRTSRWNTRWWAATSRTRWRCAAPSAWRWTWSARSASCAAARPSPAQEPWRPQACGYDPAFKSEMSDYDPPRAQGAARPARLRRPRRRRLARAARRPAAGAGIRHQPDQLRQLNELWKKNMDDIGIRIEPSRPPSGPRT
jgi:hypothetical protein